MTNSQPIKTYNHCHKSSKLMGLLSWVALYTSFLFLNLKARWKQDLSQNILCIQCRPSSLSMIQLIAEPNFLCKARTQDHRMAPLHMFIKNFLNGFIIRQFNIFTFAVYCSMFGMEMGFLYLENVECLLFVGWII